jgi:hypothetical protein
MDIKLEELKPEELKPEELKPEELKLDNLIFKLPISYLVDKHSLADHIKTDLELTSRENESLYSTVFQPKTLYGKQTIPLWSQYYTTNKDFLKDSQILLKDFKNYHADETREGFKKIDILSDTDTDADADVNTIWQEIKTETGFCEKYHYVEYKRFKPFNNNAAFLQLLSMYNMTSPLISLAIPIFFLIFPFILLKLQGIPISLTKYVEVLKTLFKQHQLGQIFTLGSASWDKIIYVVASFGFYLLQVYQNISSCIKYYYNMQKVHSQLFVMRSYLSRTLEKITQLEALAGPLKTYQPFMTDMQEHKVVLECMLKEFSTVVPNGFSLTKLKQIGHVMKCFYQLYNSNEYHRSLEYSFGLNGYIENLAGLCQRYREKQVNACRFAKREKGQVTKFKEAYFPTLANANANDTLAITKPVKNSYALDKHMLITGPNAAGKTTLLKTTLFNILFSQQTGVGFYKSASIVMYDHIHCYINIPDTSARDSLFQAEARRCKDILDSINAVENKGDTHLCVFDELYSGTNPYEAIGSAYAFLSYLNKRDNVHFVLTTHYLDLCKQLAEQHKIHNFHMEVKEKDDDFIYTYKLKNNISTIKGGVKVLRDLGYPSEITNNLLGKG